MEWAKEKREVTAGAASLKQGVPQRPGGQGSAVQKAVKSERKARGSYEPGYGRKRGRVTAAFCGRVRGGGNKMEALPERK